MVLDRMRGLVLKIYEKRRKYNVLNNMVTGKILTRQNNCFILKIHAVHSRREKKGKSDRSKSMAITRHFRKS